MTPADSPILLIKLSSDPEDASDAAVMNALAGGVDVFAVKVRE